MIVILNEVKNLAFSIAYEDEILRLAPQGDIATQSRKRGKMKKGVERFERLEQLELLQQGHRLRRGRFHLASFTEPLRGIRV
jgi:hypothetical protein